MIDNYYNRWLCDYNFSVMQSWSLEPEAGCRIELTFDPYNFDVKTRLGTGWITQDCATETCTWDYVGISYKSYCMRLCSSVSIKPFSIDDVLI